MIDFRPFEPIDLERLTLQPDQAYLRPYLPLATAYAASVGPYSFTGVFADGSLAGCAGLLPCWAGRAVVWAVLGNIASGEWVRVTAKVRAVLAAAHAAGFRRIEATVPVGFAAGHRWTKALGFAPEGIMRAYDPLGSDYTLYARVEGPASEGLE